MLNVQNISIYMHFGGGRRGSPVHFLFNIKKKQKKYKSMTYTKIKFYIIFRVTGDISAEFMAISTIAELV